MGNGVDAEGIGRAVGTPDTRRGDGNDREVDDRVAQPRAGAGDGNGYDVVVAHAVAELAQHDRDLDGLAVLVAGVVVERMRERAQSEDPIARFDVEQTASPPRSSPTVTAPSCPSS